MTKGIDPGVPTKDSGVEWLGDVPEHWELLRLKHLCLGDGSGIQMGPYGSMLTDLLHEHTDYKVYGQENIISGDFARGSRWISEAQYRELSRYHLRSGDIVLTRKGSIGNCRIVPEGIQRGIGDSDTIRVRLDEERVSPQFVDILLHQGWYIQKQFEKEKRGSVLSGLNTSTVSELLLVVPPSIEQERIMRWLGNKLGQLDSVVQGVERLIQQFQELRTSLISEVVTGKVDVRGGEAVEAVA